MSSGRKPKLTISQVEMLRARYDSWRQNHPKYIARDLGISVSAVHEYGQFKHKAPFRVG